MPKKDTKTVTIEMMLPVRVTLGVELLVDAKDGDLGANIVSVLGAHCDFPSTRVVNEAMTDEDWAELYKLLESK